MNKTDQQRLIKDIQKEPARFGQLFDAYYERILNYVLKRTFDYEVARDITSETFLKAFLSIQKFKWKEVDIVCWLYKITQNEIKLYFRSKSYRGTYLKAYFEDFHFTSTPSVEEERIAIETKLAQMQKEKQLIVLLNQLPELQRECISLKHLDNFTYEEIAQILSLKTGTVKSHISRGMEKLRKLQQQENRGIY